MMDYDPNITTRDMTIENRKCRHPMPSKQELLNRDSFDNKNRLNNNRYLTERLKEMKNETGNK